MHAIEKAIARDKKALQHLGNIVIEGEGFRLPEATLLGGLLEVVATHDQHEKEMLNEWRKEYREGHEESALKQMKKTLQRDPKVAQKFGLLLANIGAYRLRDADLLVGLRYVVATYDKDQEKREAWQLTGERFPETEGESQNPRKSAKSEGSQTVASESKAPANDDGVEEAAEAASNG